MQKKLFLLLMLFSISTLSVGCQAKVSGKKIKPCKFLSFGDAEKILGQPVELITNSWSFNNGETRFQCNYRGVKNDQESGREINLFFTLEESSDETKANMIYEKIWQSNKNHDGIEVLSGIGDKAYSHSDRSNFQFVMARKGKFTVRFKINKAVETVSFDLLKAFAKKNIEEL